MSRKQIFNLGCGGSGSAFVFGYILATPKKTEWSETITTKNSVRAVLGFNLRKR